MFTHNICLLHDAGQVAVGHRGFFNERQPSAKSVCVLLLYVNLLDRHALGVTKAKSVCKKCKIAQIYLPCYTV